MSVDNLAEMAVLEPGNDRYRKSAKDPPPVVPMSDTRATLREHPTSPLLHRPYYRSSSIKNLKKQQPGNRPRPGG
jgi:hypothetical protein